MKRSSSSGVTVSDAERYSHTGGRVLAGRAFERFWKMHVTDSKIVSVSEALSPQREAHRKALQECCACFKTRICGQAFTEYFCAACSKEDSYGNTCVPKFCQQCASMNDTCRRCGLPVNPPGPTA